MQGNKSKSAGSPSLDKSKVEFGIRAAFIRGLIKRSDLSVRLRKGNKTPKGCKCAEAFAHFLTSLARSKKLVGQVVYHTNSVSLEAVLADDRDWGGVKGGSWSRLCKEGASTPPVTAWGSASVIPRAASEPSERRFLKISLTSVVSSAYHIFKYSEEQFMENSKMQPNITEFTQHKTHLEYH